MGTSTHRYDAFYSLFTRNQSDESLLVFLSFLLMGWIAVDLDGTLAERDDSRDWRGQDDIGNPIEPMVELVKKWLADGRHVKIFTARASYPDFDPQYVEDWCEEHLGQVLEITCKKDSECEAIYDDIAFHVVRNTGEIIP